MSATHGGSRAQSASSRQSTAQPADLVPAGKELGVGFENADDRESATIRVSLSKDLRKGPFRCGLRIHFEGGKYEPREVRLIGTVR